MAQSRHRGPQRGSVSGGIPGVPQELSGWPNVSISKQKGTVRVAIGPLRVRRAPARAFSSVADPYISEVRGCLSLRAQPGNRFVSFVRGVCDATRREIIIRWVVLRHGRFLLLLPTAIFLNCLRFIEGPMSIACQDMMKIFGPSIYLLKPLPERSFT